MAVNGGETLTVDYMKAGYIPAQRTVEIGMLRFTGFPDVALIPPDDNATVINLAGLTDIAVAQSGVSTDASGTRQAILRRSPGHDRHRHSRRGERIDATCPRLPCAVRVHRRRAWARGDAGGLSSADERLHVRAGGQRGRGPLACGELPSSSQPAIDYVDNFLNVPAGTRMPVGYYDRDKRHGLPSETAG